MGDNWAKWDAEHGSGGHESSADKIAASIRGALGHTDSDAKTDTKETRKAGRSTVSRATGARSSVSHVAKKDLKRPAPVKGEKDAGDSFKTKIRMAAYNAKKKKAVADDPVDKHTPKTEIKLNPHSSSAAALAARIKETHAEHAKLAPPKVIHAPGSLEDNAQKAEEATVKAQAHATKENHIGAANLHKKAATMGQANEAKASTYHHEMASYHEHAAFHSDTLIPAGVKEEHKDEQASKFPSAVHSMLSSFMDTVSRRRSQKMYDAVPKAAESKLTPSQKSAVRQYTGSNYRTINDHLRGTHTLPDGGAKTDTEKTISDLDDAFAKQPGLAHDLITYRGTNGADKLFGPVGSKVGGEFQDLGYGSTASHASITAGFGSGSGALVRIVHPAGSKLLKPSEVGAFGDSERELMVPRGARYHVAADRLVTTNTGKQKRVIDLIRK